jgi:uncharacterized radical SAM protein YgiQ
VCASKTEFARATRLFHHETNPLNARRLIQAQGDRRLVLNPPALALSESEMDAVHELPYARSEHPRYGEEIPAWQTIQHSVQIMRGCFGGCSFCSITMHQGRAIQSRSHGSIVRELEQMAGRSDFKGHVSDVGGPTANMYRMRCSQPKVEAKCRRLSCVSPKICKLLDTSHAPLRELLSESRDIAGIKKIHVASGIRMDLAALDPDYLEDVARHHVGGHLKVAPEHVSAKVLEKMKKPGPESFDLFAERFQAASERAGKEQYLVPYFIASHPGSGIEEMIELALYLKKGGYRPRQVQDFIPAPMDVATCMYYTGLDPETMQPVESAKGAKDRGVQRALLQYWKPENYVEVKRALERVGRTDLIGDGAECLIPARAPRVRREPVMQEKRAGGKAGYRRAARSRGKRDRR